MLDVSEFQGGINWTVLHPEKILIRLTMGSAGVDAQAINNLKGARERKFIFGGYHFLENSDPKAQVEHFLGVWHPVAGGLRGMLDCERSPFSHPTKNLLTEAVTVYRGATGHYPIVYGNSGDLGNLDLPEWMAKCPLMLADYGPNDGSEHPLSIGVPKPWKVMAIHQYTSEAHVPGITANSVDLSDVKTPAAIVVPTPRPVIDKWQVSYVPKNGKRTRKFTRTPTAFQVAHSRAKYRGAIHVYPHREEK